MSKNIEIIDNELNLLAFKGSEIIEFLEKERIGEIPKDLSNITIITRPTDWWGLVRWFFGEKPDFRSDKLEKMSLYLDLLDEIRKKEKVSDKVYQVWRHKLLQEF